MKKIILLAAVTSLALPLYAADPKHAMDPIELEMMKKFEEAATPGAPHKMLAEKAGEWTYTSKWWDSKDQKKPQTSKGTSTMTMILGGRWLQQNFKGTAMGQPFEGLGLVGYDNIKGTYESLWLDTMSTALMHGTGSYDASTKTLKDSGTHSCPISADKTQSFRSEWLMKDKNNMVFSMYGKGFAGKEEFLQMEITYTRAKK